MGTLERPAFVGIETVVIFLVGITTMLGRVAIDMVPTFEYLEISRARVCV